MATITLTIPDAVLARVLEAVCARYRYDPASGLTEVQFAKRVLIDWLRGLVKGYEADQAAATARVAACQAVDQEITIT